MRVAASTVRFPKRGVERSADEIGVTNEQFTVGSGTGNRPEESLHRPRLRST
jgi:hypothetical protein